MTPPTSLEMATELYDILKATGLTEDAVPLGDRVYVARRNSDELCHQIFRSNDPTPLGVVEPHLCEFFGNEWRLLVDTDSQSGRGSVCVHTYLDALNHLRMADETGAAS